MFETASWTLRFVTDRDTRPLLQFFQYFTGQIEGLLTSLSRSITFLAHTAGQRRKQRLVGANALDINLVAASIVGDAGLGASWQTWDLCEGSGREEGDCEGGSGEHGPVVSRALWGRMDVGGVETTGGHDAVDR